MSKFKVGDRVAHYLGRDRFIAEVKQIDENGTLYLQNKRLSIWAHPKQCRRLRKKAPLECYVNIYPGGYLSSWDSRENAENGKAPEALEVGVRMVRAKDQKR